MPESTASGCLLTLAGGTKPREAGESPAVDVSEQQKKPRQSGVGAAEQQLCGSQTQFAQPSSSYQIADARSFYYSSSLIKVLFLVICVNGEY